MTVLFLELISFLVVSSLVVIGFGVDRWNKSFCKEALREKSAMSHSR